MEAAVAQRQPPAPTGALKVEPLKTAPSTSAPRPGPDAAGKRYVALPLPALARIVSFFPFGVPRAFAAASPLARIAAETYRAEENYRWTPKGLMRREPGERETFDTYEARRQRRAGVQLGRLITVYHDCVGRLRRCTEPVLPWQAPVCVEEAVDLWRDRRREAATAAACGGGAAAGVGLLVEEWRAKPLVTTPGVERETEEAREVVAASGADLLDVHLEERGTTTVQLDDGHRVYYFAGPNKRSIYLWLDSPVRRSNIRLSEEEQRALHTELDETLDQALPTVEEENAAGLQRLKELVERSRWWLQRPAVSSMRYLAEVYGKNSTLLPPPPPALYLHLYGQCPSAIPLVCEAFLSPPPTAAASSSAAWETSQSYLCSPHGNPPHHLYSVASPLSETAAALQETKNRQLEGLFGTAKSTWLSTQGAMLAGAPPGNALSLPRAAPTPQSVVARREAQHILQRVTMPVLEGLIVVGYPLMAMQLLAPPHEERGAGGPPPQRAGSKNSAGGPPAWLGHMEEDWIEACQDGGGGGLGLQWQERQALHQLPDTMPPSPALSVPSTQVPSTPPAGVPCSLEREWIGRLRLLKFHGVRFDDNGLRSFIGAVLPPLPPADPNARNSDADFAFNEVSTQALREGFGGNSGRSLRPEGEAQLTPRSGALPGLRGGDMYKVAITPVMPFLEVCDIALNLELTVFPLLSKEGSQEADTVVYSGIRLLPVVSLRHLTLLHLQGTGIQQAVLDLIGLSCPALQSLYVGSCPFIRSVEPLGLLPSLRQLDLHGTALTDEGITSFMSPWGFPKLEELSLAGCTAINNISPLGHLKKLRKLDLRYVPIREGLMELKDCPRLQELLFSSSVRLAAQMLHRQPEWRRPTFLHHFHTLTALTLDNVPLFNQEGIKAIVKARAGLRRVVLLHMNRLDSVAGLQSVPTLEYLHIEDAPLFMEDGLFGLGSHCPRLHTVLLHDCPMLDCLRGLAGAAGLEHLEFVRNSQETVAADALLPLCGRTPDAAYKSRCSSHSTHSETHSAAKAGGPQPHRPASLAGLPCPLQVLRLPGYPHLDTLQPLSSCAALLAGLSILDVSHTAITNRVVEELGTGVDGIALEALYLRGCRAVSRVNALMHLPHLRLLDVSHTAVSDGGIGSLKAAPALKTLLLEHCSEMQFLPHSDFFPHLRVLRLSDNDQLDTRRLKQFFSFVDDCEEKIKNPLESPLRLLEELHLQGCSIDSVRPLVMQKALRLLDISNTAVTSEGLRHLSELSHLRHLTITAVASGLVGGSLRPLFTHPAIRTLDLRRTALDLSDPDALQLPIAVLAVSPVVELLVSGRTQLLLLLPLLLHPQALPALRLLAVEDNDFLTSDHGEVRMAAALPPDVAALALPSGSSLKNESALALRSNTAAAERRRHGTGGEPVVGMGEPNSSRRPPSRSAARHPCATPCSGTDTSDEAQGGIAGSSDQTNSSLLQSLPDRGRHDRPAGPPVLETVEVHLHRVQKALAAISAARPLVSVRRLA